MDASGQGGPQDYGQAIGWYRKAADQGYAPAQFNLGVMFATGQGVPQDYGQAIGWYRKAADQGYARAQFSLGGGRRSVLSSWVISLRCDTREPSPFPTSRTPGRTGTG